MTMRTAASATTPSAAPGQRPEPAGQGWLRRPAGEPRLEMIMPIQIGRDELPALTRRGAQLVEVLPAGDYDWAHLPGAVNLAVQGTRRQDLSPQAA
jgi:hypothetical protein